MFSLISGIYTFTFVLLCTAAKFCFICLDGSFGLGSFYASNMVLQRATPTNPDLQAQLWGPAGQIGDPVEVVFDGNVYNTEAFDTPGGTKMLE